MLIAVLSRSSDIIANVRSISLLDSDVQVMESRRASELIRKMRRVIVDLVIVDAERELESAEIIASWRACHVRMDFAVVLVGGIVGWQHMARAFELGVDDIVVGRLRIDELYVRCMRCIAQARGSQKRKGAMQLGAYQLNQRTQCITGNGGSVQLTGQEFALASLFFSKPGALLGRERIAATIWGRCGHDCGRTLEQAIYRLRCKLQLLPDTSLRINAVYAQGYKIAVGMSPERGERASDTDTSWRIDPPSSSNRRGRGARRFLMHDVRRRSAKGWGTTERPFHQD